MGIRTKILSGFLILCSILVITGAWSLYHFNHIGSSVRKLLDDNYRSIAAAMTMIEALEQEDSGLLLIQQGRLLEGHSNLTAADSLFLSSARVAVENITIDTETAILDSIQARYIRYKQIWAAPAFDDQTEGDLDWYYTTDHPAFIAVKESVYRLMMVNNLELYTRAVKLRNQANRAAMPGIVTIIVALLFSLMFAYFVNFYIARPIVRLTRAIRRFVNSGEPIDVTVRTKDEIADLISAVKYLSSRINSSGSDK